MAVDHLNDKVKINKMEDVVRQIYGKIRSGFLHNMKFDSLPEDSLVILPEGEGKARLLENLNAGKFIYLSWKAIFRYFGYKKL